MFRHQGTRLFLAAAVAALLLAPAAGQARGLSLTSGRTKAIKTQLAQRLNKANLFHVGRYNRASDFRIRTRLVKNVGRLTLLGSQNRKVNWKLRSGIVRGTAKATTPIVLNGGRYTRVNDFRITMMPRRAPRRTPTLP